MTKTESELHGIFKNADDYREKREQARRREWARRFWIMCVVLGVAMFAGALTGGLLAYHFLDNRCDAAHVVHAGK